MKLFLLTFDDYLETRPIGLFRREPDVVDAISKLSSKDDGIYTTWVIEPDSLLGVRRLSSSTTSGGREVDIDELTSDPDGLPGVFDDDGFEEEEEEDFE